LVETLDIANRPTANGAFAGHAGIATDGAKALALGHSGADGFGDFAGVVRLRHSSSFF
jgi:hypothetical protein